MATNQAPPAQATQDSPITVKISYNGENRKFKFPLMDLTAIVFVNKIRTLLAIPREKSLLVERFSDSSGAFMTLDPAIPSSYKQLYRAAKAKSKIRLRIKVISDEAGKPADPEPSKSEPVATAEESKAPLIVPTVTEKIPAPSVAETDDKQSVSSHTVKVDDNDIARSHYHDQLAGISWERQLGMRLREPPSPQTCGTTWQVHCNSCDRNIVDGHFHCGICDGGDYDLCEACVNAGVVCPGQGHWLIKRFVKGGKVVTSTTERLGPRPRTQEPKSTEVPREAKIEQPHMDRTRTCNSCIRVLPEKLLVTCIDCEDYDLCISCLVESKHGHHPAHSFGAISESAMMSYQAAALCAPGRRQRHCAICDGCEKNITGVRHKCLDCPDFDFCGACIENGRRSHGHRFVPVYEPLATPQGPKTRHVGIYCDGPLCADEKRTQQYIRGIRYKCTICHDTDFCANCEAHPSNKHNKTHPLIKFNTMVRDVRVSTVEEVNGGHVRRDLGDKSTSSVPVSPTLEQEVHRRPSAPDVQSAKTTSIEDRVQAEASTAPAPQDTSTRALNAVFESDSVADGSKMVTGNRFVQKWTMRNPGPSAWPAGCSVRHVGGDNMLDLDHDRATLLTSLQQAMESNRTDKVIAVGAQETFQVSLRASARPGQYISYWRLKAPDGTPFGHKLWCDVRVTEPADTPQKTASNQSSPASRLDYQMQLLLLEQQSKKRLLQARAEMETAHTLPTPEVSNEAGIAADLEKALPSAPTTEIDEHASEVNSSRMVFPTLEKESPSSSTHQDLVKSESASSQGKDFGVGEDVKSRTAAVATETAAEKAPEGLDKDVEYLDYTDEEEEDEGFLTDEEYDILDASDEEIINSGNPNTA